MTDRQAYIKQETDWGPVLTGFYIGVWVLVHASFAVWAYSRFTTGPNGITSASSNIWFISMIVAVLMFLGRNSITRELGRDFDTYAGCAERLGIDISKVKAVDLLLGRKLTDERLASCTADELLRACQAKFDYDNQRFLVDQFYAIAREEFETGTFPAGRDAWARITHYRRFADIRSLNLESAIKGRYHRTPRWK